MKFHQLYFFRLCQAILSKHACMCDVLASPFTRCVYCAGIHQSCQTTVVTRKPPQYQRNIWAHEFVESLHNHYQERSYIRRIEKLKEDVRQLLLECMVGPSARLELIDAIQRLGVGYHFVKEIKKTIEFMWFNQDTFVGNNLHSVALYFRLLRQHGYQVSQDVFAGFLDHRGSFLEELSKDVKGMLSLYQASYLCLDGENIMTEANMFTVRNLSGQRQKGVTHALELPLHWRTSRLEGRWYIEESQRAQNIHPSLLELSQMDFNFVQRIHQKELRNMSRWWRELDLSSSLSFARDRLVESFLWSVGLAYEPQHGRCREWLTKVISFILTIDDIYDIHGSLDELERFTNAVERWDNEAIEYLPDYMKICFLALYNTTNDMAYTIYTEQTWDILPYLRKVWEDYCKAMLLEANWSNKKYTPSLEEYLANAWVSSSTPVGLVHAFFTSKQKITDGVLKCLYNNHEPIRSSSLIFRLWNDLATSSVELQRGDGPSAVQCYMRDNNTSEDFAREKIKGLITNMWKGLNESMYDSPFDHSFVIIAMNHVRNGHCFYQHGDGFSVQDHEAKERVKALLVKPFVLRGGESCDTFSVNSHISKEKEEWESENGDPEEGSHTNMENQVHVEVGATRYTTNVESFVPEVSFEATHLGPVKEANVVGNNGVFEMGGPSALGHKEGIRSHNNNKQSNTISKRVTVGSKEEPMGQDEQGNTEDSKVKKEHLGFDGVNEVENIGMFREIQAKNERVDELGQAIQEEKKKEREAIKEMMRSDPYYIAKKVPAGYRTRKWKKLMKRKVLAKRRGKETMGKCKGEGSCTSRKHVSNSSGQGRSNNSLESGQAQSPKKTVRRKENDGDEGERRLAKLAKYHAQEGTAEKKRCIEKQNDLAGLSFCPGSNADCVMRMIRGPGTSERDEGIETPETTGVGENTLVVLSPLGLK